MAFMSENSSRGPLREQQQSDRPERSRDCYTDGERPKTKFAAAVVHSMPGTGSSRSSNAVDDD